jgi:hypothetical protein
MMNGSPGMDVDGSGTDDLEEWLMGNRKIGTGSSGSSGSQTEIGPSDFRKSDWENMGKNHHINYHHAIQLPDYSVFTLFFYVFFAIGEETCSDMF